MDIEQISASNLQTGDALHKGKNVDRVSHKQGKLKFIVGGILVVLGCMALLFYLNPFGSEALIDYDKFPYLKLTSPDDPDMDWNVWVDTPNNQVFLLKTLTPSDSAAEGQIRRLLLSERNTENGDETRVLQVILQKFNQDHITIYHLFEGDFEHVHCFRYPLAQGSELIPRLDRSQFSERTKTVLSGDGGTYELKSAESRVSVEVKTGSQGSLLKAKFTDWQKSDHIHPDNGTKVTPAPNDSGNKELVPLKPGDVIIPADPKTSPDVIPMPTLRNLSVSLEVTEPFEIDRIKTKLYAAGQCFEYNTKFDTPEIAYERSKMKLNHVEYNKKSENILKDIEEVKKEVSNITDILKKNISNPTGSIDEKAANITKTELPRRLLENDSNDDLSNYGNWCKPKLIEHNHYSKWPLEIDYVDHQCKSFSKCMQKHETKGWGSSGCKAENPQMSDDIPCECTLPYIKKLGQKSLFEYCGDNDDCINYGNRFKHALENQPCGCKIAQCPHRSVWNGLTHMFHHSCVHYHACLKPYACNALRPKKKNF